MGETPRKVVYTHAIWDWIDQKMSKSSMRDEEAKELKEAGTLVAIQEAAYRRALHDLMDEVLDEDGHYVVDLDAEKEKEEEWEEEFAQNNPNWNKIEDEKLNDDSDLSS